MSADSQRAALDGQANVRQQQVAGALPVCVRPAIFAGPILRLFFLQLVVDPVWVLGVKITQHILAAAEISKFAPHQHGDHMSVCQ